MCPPVLVRALYAIWADLRVRPQNRLRSGEDGRTHRSAPTVGASTPPIESSGLYVKLLLVMPPSWLIAYDAKQGSLRSE